MKITYTSELKSNEACITTAHCQIPLFGRWAELAIKSYCIENNTAVSFDLRNIPNSELKCSSFDAAINGVFHISRGINGNRQVFDQHLRVPHIFGLLLDYSELQDGGVEAGRTVVDSILRRVESIIETVRQDIIKNTCQDLRQTVLKTLHDRYYKPTRLAIETLLGGINWRLMFRQSGCDEEQLRVIDYSMLNNPLRFNSLLNSADTDIPLIQCSSLGQFDSSTIANLKATTLLKMVCGEELGKEFEKMGHITVKSQGYTFVVSPRSFVECTDPNGKKARLCIHVQSYQCNPIDELTIAYLHIKHQLAEYLDEAILQGHDAGFQKNLRVKQQAA
jgi:hypothetical protein